MFQDHLPDHQLSALEQLLTKMGPPKPQRMLTTCSSRLSNNYSVPIYCSLGSLARTVTPDSLDTITANGSNRVLLETSFTDLRPTGEMNDVSPRYKSKSNSIRPSLLSALKYHGKTDVLRDHRHVLRSSPAPLATPESLSETSSIRSRSSLSLNQTGQDFVERLAEGAKIERESKLKGSLDTRIMKKEEKDEEEEESKMEERCPTNEPCDLESFARSEISLQELMDAFSSGKTSPSSSFKDTTKHVTFDPSTTPPSSILSSSFSHSSFYHPQTVIEFDEQTGEQKLPHKFR